MDMQASKFRIRGPDCNKRPGDLVLAADSAAFQLPGAASGGFCQIAKIRFGFDMGLLGDEPPNRVSLQV